MVKILKINDVKKRIKVKHFFLEKKLGDKLVVEIINEDLRDLNILLKRVENGEKIKANWF